MTSVAGNFTHATHTHTHTVRMHAFTEHAHLTAITPQTYTHTPAPKTTRRAPTRICFSHSLSLFLGAISIRQGFPRFLCVCVLMLAERKLCGWKHRSAAVPNSITLWPRTDTHARTHAIAAACCLRLCPRLHTICSLECGVWGGLVIAATSTRVDWVGGIGMVFGFGWIVGERVSRSPLARRAFHDDHREARTHWGNAERERENSRDRE